MTNKELMKKLVRTELEVAFHYQREAFDVAKKIELITGSGEETIHRLGMLACLRYDEGLPEQELDEFIPPANRSEVMRKLVRPEVEAGIRFQCQSWKAVDRIQEVTGRQYVELHCDVMDLCARHGNNEELLDKEMDYLFQATQQPDGPTGLMLQ